MRLPASLVLVLVPAACATAPAAAAPRPERAARAEPRIDPGDPIAPIAREEEARLRDAPRSLPRTVSPATPVASTALARVFPGYRFLKIAWQDHGVDPNGHPVGVAFGLYAITAVAPDGSRSRHFGSGDHESFGKLLADARAEIATEEQSQLVWRAYCDLFGGSRALPCERQSPTSWRLGLSEVRGRRYWYDVAVDASGHVISGRLRSAP